ncbi:hypothetical protein MOJ79_16280 [Calidifontimicrobium sp. SYSU G02091]|uniref:hypothetical protein n=1 Tax=Calidifontimicrobium sp. SYSU G02091 TaxID=2926421 RepID=UPI001F52B6D7|nr:hypothetical protein [Calidifontimicrobium sp. SYSU G02091]MCI1193392.1 hypothetical protein [Calidifontimicrobium sp. SYSU G02091]
MTRDTIYPKAMDRLIWRYLRDEGGWHSRDDLIRALALDGTGERMLRDSLRRLLRNAAIKLRCTHDGVVTYGVTAHCEPPDGETIVPDSHRPMGDA